MKDNRAQVSLEYLLIFSVSLILMIVFTMPLLNEVMDNTFDVSDSLNVKSDLSDIAQAIRQVYGQGQGSKQTIKVNSNRNIKVNVNPEYISSNIKLKNGKYHEIRIDAKSNLDSDSIYLEKGLNTVVVEWPVGEKMMVIY